MAFKLGRNRNKNDTATVSAGITLNSTTSTVILAANPNRMSFDVNNNFSNQAAWVKMQAASTDNDKKGIFLNKKNAGISSWSMSPDNIYTGEISAIADSGSPTVYVTEY